MAYSETITTYSRWGSFGTGDGQFWHVSGIVVDSTRGFVYVLDSGRQCIQKFDLKGKFILKWGEEYQWNPVYGLTISKLTGIAVDSGGNVYVTDFNYNLVHKFDSNGNFITKWGSKWGESGQADGLFSGPSGVAVDSLGYVYVAEMGNHRVQKFDPNGRFITKWASYSTSDSAFARPNGLAVDSSGYVYYSDYGNSYIEKFDSNGILIKKWGSRGTGDGQFNGLYDIAVDNARGYVYAPDLWNHRVQKFDVNGEFILKWGSLGRGEGQFRGEITVAVDNTNGTIYAGDTSDSRIQAWFFTVFVSRNW